MRFSQVRLLVDGFGEAFGFYRDTLDLPLGFGDQASGYASFTVGDGVVAVFERNEQAEAVELRPPGDGVLLVLEVDDVDAAAERIRGYGLASEPVTRVDWGIRLFHVRDPAGNLLEIVSDLE